MSLSSTSLKYIRNSIFFYLRLRPRNYCDELLCPRLMSATATLLKDSETPDSSEEREELVVTFNPPLYLQRQIWLLSTLTREKVRSVSEPRQVLVLDTLNPITS